MIIALQALSLVEKEEPAQVCFTLRLRDQQSKWRQDGCKVYMDSFVASNGLWIYISWSLVKSCIHLLCWKWLGPASEHFFWGTHNFMVMALGSCVKWTWRWLPQISSTSEHVHKLFSKLKIKGALIKVFSQLPRFDIFWRLKNCATFESRPS